MHDVGDPAAHGSFDYLEMPNEEYSRTVRGPLLPEDHSLVTYVQGLADQFDHLLRMRYARQMAGVPRARVAVRKTPESGAFTADFRRVCYEVPVVITEGIPDLPENRLQAIEPAPGLLRPSQFISCKMIPVAPDRYSEFAEWYSKRFAPCGLAMRDGIGEGGRPGLVMTGPCKNEDFFPRKSRTGGIIVKAAPNRILVFSGLFRLLKSEDELAAVIAHELAHYYRAHVADVRQYEYCYKITPDNHGHRPKPDPEMDDLCEKLRPRINFPLEEATSRRLGVYTIEQEADEIAVELLAMAGIPPTAAADAWLALSADMTSEAPAPPALPMDECRRLRSNGWRDSQGQNVFVPVGDYYNAHHSWCYRIHNIDKEIAAHRFPEIPRAFPAADWQAIQRQL
ncbi:MAG: Peptidase family [Pseudomonadota bacterium]